MQNTSAYTVLAGFCTINIRALVSTYRDHDFRALPMFDFLGMAKDNSVCSRRTGKRDSVILVWPAIMPAAMRGKLCHLPKVS
jgi:hypothetical protein